eukprot:TRINITY_DN23643_c0_g1_i1.p1 TRINITY_DN23643_c0_g1~~TRINITY_DN23643_c0_g1_i1.p1  ORF type:complete len:111 (-),score=65.36 TRINITY_DN23643_c0_g1_i1:77-409(-)
MIRRPPRSTQSRSSAASDVYKRQERALSAERWVHRFREFKHLFIAEVEATGDLSLRSSNLNFVQTLDQMLDTEENELAAARQQLEEGKGCLLYTSPSPRDRTRSRMPSSA